MRNPPAPRPAAASTIESVGRGLDNAVARGQIRAWRVVPGNKWSAFVDLVDGESSFPLGTLTEGAVFCAAVASAWHAQQRAAGDLAGRILPVLVQSAYDLGAPPEATARAIARALA